MTEHKFQIGTLVRHKTSTKTFAIVAKMTIDYGTGALNAYLVGSARPIKGQYANVRVYESELVNF